MAAELPKETIFGVATEAPALVFIIYLKPQPNPGASLGCKFYTPLASPRLAASSPQLACSRAPAERNDFTLTLHIYIMAETCQAYIWGRPACAPPVEWPQAAGRCNWISRSAFTCQPGCAPPMTARANHIVCLVVGRLLVVVVCVAAAAAGEPNLFAPLGKRSFTASHMRVDE